MKKLSRFSKIVFYINIICALLTLLAYLLPFLPPDVFPILSVFTLAIPLLFILHGLFCFYWSIFLKKHFILSALVLLVGIGFINRFYKFYGKDEIDTEKSFIVMSYNVRVMNLFKWLERDDVPEKIMTFINEKNPDILCLQEFSNSINADFKLYPHKFIIVEGQQVKTAQAIFSKFPIVNKGSIIFSNSDLDYNGDNYVIYADIKKGKDIIRVYNMHLESIKITDNIVEINKRNMDAIDQDKTKIIIKRVAKAFKLQQEQAKQIKEHKKKCPYPIIMCGDMNNSAFSYVYRQIKGSSYDAFEEAGVGFGSTYKFRYYPARIDYIFADKQMQVKKFESFSDFDNSDHYPILAKLSMK